MLANLVLMQPYLLLLLLNVACAFEQAQTEEKAGLEKLNQEEVFLQSISQLKPEKDSIPEITLSKAALLGQLNPAQDSDFTRISTKYTDKDSIYLRKQAYQAFVQMAQTAREAGISLQIISATRNFTAQKRIWEAKWNGQRPVGGQDLSQTIPNAKERALKILEYSSMPGTSRHHWGTDIDLNALTNNYFASGEGKKIYDWLQLHAHTYGFCQVYTEQGEERPGGYQEEKWHWSYMPLAHQFLRQYNATISYDDLGNFDGGSVAEEVEAIRLYVNGIAPRCRDWKK